MLHCKIVACKCYLAAALGTLGDEAERQQTPDFWHRRRQFLPELPKSRARPDGISRGNLQRRRMISTALLNSPLPLTSRPDWAAFIASLFASPKGEAAMEPLIAGP